MSPSTQATENEVPIPVSTAFISSRMEELAIERRAAFNATYESQIVPLLFETEPPAWTLKSHLDRLVDRADIFVGVYYKSMGTRHAALYNMTPIEYEFLRFLEVWRLRIKYSRMVGSDRTDDADSLRAFASGVIPSLADTSLALLGGHGESSLGAARRVRTALFRALWWSANVPSGSMSSALRAFRQSLAREQFTKKEWDTYRIYFSRRTLLLYRRIVRTRVFILVRSDTEEYWLQEDLSAFLPREGHFSRVTFTSRKVANASTASDSAVRFSEPAVELYKAMKQRLRIARHKKVLRIDKNSPFGRRSRPSSPPPQEFTFIIRFGADVPGVLETLLDAFFSLSLSISLMVSLRDQSGLAWAAVSLVPWNQSQHLDLRGIVEDVQVLVTQVFEKHERKETQLPANVKPPPGIWLLPNAITTMDKAYIELLKRARPKTPGKKRSRRTALFEIQGADVPGIFLSVTRIFANADANIARVEFSSDPNDQGTTQGKHPFLARNHFYGCMWIEYPKQRNVLKRRIWKERSQEIRFRLLSLLGVQTVQFLPQPATSIAEPGYRSRA